MSQLALVASAISSIIGKPVKTYDECVAKGLTILPEQILDIDFIHKKTLTYVDLKYSPKDDKVPSKFGKDSKIPSKFDTKDDKVPSKFDTKNDKFPSKFDTKGDKVPSNIDTKVSYSNIAAKATLTSSYNIGAKISPYNISTSVTPSYNIAANVSPPSNINNIVNKVPPPSNIPAKVVPSYNVVANVPPSSNIVPNVSPSSNIVHIQVFLKPLVGDSQSMLIDPNITVLELKQVIHKRFGSDIKTTRLSFSGKQLDDHKTLAHYNVHKGCTIHILSRIFGGIDFDFYVIREDLLSPSFHYDFTNINDIGRAFIRGNETYKRPCGWERLAFNVGKYGPDARWLGHVGNSPHEWPVSYHGTKREFVESIASEGYLLDRGTRFIFGRGIYSSPDIGIAEMYAAPFYHEDAIYKFVIQNRVNSVRRERCHDGNYWVVPDEEDMRPYGLCVKRVYDDYEFYEQM